MKVIIKKPLSNYVSSKVREALAVGKIVTVYIAEHEKHGKPEHGWYLVNSGVEQQGIHNSDRDVEVGSIIRTYQDPELGSYKNGPYMWVVQQDCEIFFENNKGAKMLLESSEWNVK